jgi:ubiquinone/menaquinone biosynthesis C-methylase UbiE
MPRGWQWDETLFRGSARYYERGRLPYPPGLASAVAAVLGLDGSGRLLDVGCGPGTVALRLAHLFQEVVGLDADAEMLAEAERRAGELRIRNARWVRARAEELPSGLGSFRVAVFAQSFHWMERERVAAAVFAVLEPCGAAVQISDHAQAGTQPSAPLPYPSPPYEAIQASVCRYLGPVRRAGQGVLRYGTPAGEDQVFRGAGFEVMETATVRGGEALVRSVDDVVAAWYSTSASAPHLFGDQLSAFDAELRGLLAQESPSGLFSEETRDAEIRVWRKPGTRRDLPQKPTSREETPAN